ncbi:hypothetical protein N599_30260 [Saccharopolyspora erythraea D]|nr:hypothetical protein N599_30260 [Saccharopolyspora erythraea D]
MPAAGRYVIAPSSVLPSSGMVFGSVLREEG